jgi:cobalt-zinc-cadmium efflux system outer membrane protein
MPYAHAWWSALLCAATIASAPPARGAAEPVLTLAEALRRADAASPDLHVADAAIDAARGRARQAGLPPNPEARLQVEDAGGTGPYRDFNAAQTTLSLAQTLELGGKRRTRLTAAETDLRVAELKRAITGADLRRTLEERYAEAWAAQARLQLADDALRRAQDLERATREMVDAGREAPLRGLRVRGQLAEARAERESAAAALASAKSALAALWAEPRPAFALEQPEIEAAPGGPKDEPLNVQLAEAELAAARAGVAREKALSVPNVTVEAGVRHYGDTGDQAYVVGLSAPIPLWDRNQGATAAARADALSAEVRRNAALATAIRDERDARAQVAAAEAQLAALQSGAVPDAERALKLARLGYQAGKFSLLDVLDAETTLSSVRNSAVQARLARAKAQAALSRALSR